MHRGKGIIFLYCNYAGDNMNFDIAAELLGDEEIETRTIRVRDDVAAAPPERMDDRRGIAGAVLVVKIASSAATELKEHRRDRTHHPQGRGQCPVDGRCRIRRLAA